MKTKELEIELPWGYVSAKAWGNETDQVVIALHGFMDNANTYDQLIPLLPSNFYYICIDLPSHGKSTRLPTQLFPHLIDYVLALKLILDRLNKRKYILMGHSFGARTAVCFAQIYPEHVSKLICLDATYYFPIEPSYLPQYISDTFKLYEKSLKNNKEQPSYTEEELLYRVMNGRYTEVSESSAKVLMERVKVPVEGGTFKISTAQHLKYCLHFPFSYDYVIQLLRLFPIRCPHLVLNADEGEGLGNQEVLEEFKKNENYVFHLLSGNHDIHMDNPRLIAPYVCKFLLKSKL